MGLCGLTYYNCYGFVLMSIPLFFFSIFRTKRDRAYILRLTALIDGLGIGVLTGRPGRSVDRMRGVLREFIERDVAAGRDHP